MIVHLSGRENRDNPGVWVFSKLSICLDCGFLQSKIPATQVAQLVAGEDVLSADRIRREA
jgi:hypothetical protein